MIVDTLKVFVTVVEQSNFSRAAEIEAGHILYAPAKQILSQYEAASEGISLLRNEVTGSLKIESALYGG